MFLSQSWDIYLPLNFFWFKFQQFLILNAILSQDQLAPFDCGSDPAEKAILNTDSPDFWCQNSLLKLQSLLLSPLCKNNRNKELWDSCKEIISSYLNVKDETIGSLSLKLICILDDTKAR
jgi:hypothetical protein